MVTATETAQNDAQTATTLTTLGAVPGPTAAPQAATTQEPAKPAAPTLVDFDHGGNWGSETLTLLHPFQLRGATYMSITIRTASGNDLANYLDGARDIVEFAHALTGVEAEVLRTMHADDYKAVSKKVAAFLI